MKSWRFLLSALLLAGLAYAQKAGASQIPAAAIGKATGTMLLHEAEVAKGGQKQDVVCRADGRGAPRQ